MNKLMWWGYLHKNGSIQCKRYLGNPEEYDVSDSPFVLAVCKPFEAKLRIDAIEILKRNL